MAYKTFFVQCCLCILIVCPSGITTTSIIINREKHDKFFLQNLTHLESQKSKQSPENLCKSFKAECKNDECESCQCSEEDRNTLLLLTPTTGNCTKDQDIIPESVTNEHFLLSMERGSSCLTVTGKRNENVFGTDCNPSLNMRMRWIWVNETGKIQLMNAMTLQCLEFVIPMSACDSSDGTVEYPVVMRQCDRTNRQQHIYEKGNYIYTKMCDGNWKFYLEINEHSKKAKSKRSSTGQVWKNEYDRGPLKRKTITYNGCYRFSNETFMLYLDKDVCSTKPCTRNFFAPIFSENSQCSIIWSKSTIMRSDMWQKVTNMTNKKPIFMKGVSKHLKMLKIREEAFNIFNGTLLKLAISCKNKTHESKKEDHCLLLKFRFKKQADVKEWKMKTISTTTAKIRDTTVILSPTTAKVGDTTAISKHKESTESKENSFVTIVIAVSVSVLIIVLVLVAAYFYRKRFAKDQNSSPVVEELPEMRNLSSNQATPTESEIHAMPRAEQEYLYENTKQRISCAHSQGPEYEHSDWSPKYESPEVHPNRRYEYPSLGATGKKDVGVKDGEYFPLRKPLFKNDEDDLPSYTSLLKTK
ncbi:uncharacterized protein LOC114533534 isoform X2 [Dendronephthya gigantea]|uniref:uncharacterized protein LOC114533534 isoform X2 n=1 Tax=Dendronephthya gigantea TaxID=151771 RepID=UPI00106A22F6|nr:uncharacterized protein LOC114533534 isoform X2 [Dendronephthya gigantea]